mgnify:CR=1 FL=1
MRDVGSRGDRAMLPVSRITHHASRITDSPPPSPTTTVSSATQAAPPANQPAGPSTATPTGAASSSATTTRSTSRVSSTTNATPSSAWRKSLARLSAMLFVGGPTVRSSSHPRLTEILPRDFSESGLHFGLLADVGLHLATLTTTSKKRNRQTQLPPTGPGHRQRAEATVRRTGPARHRRDARGSKAVRRGRWAVRWAASCATSGL